MNKNITGIILAGGKNSRMGKDKSFLLHNKKPLVETAIEKLSSVFGKLLIITNDPKSYKKYNIDIHEDIIKERGPLGGIYTGLCASKTTYNFFIACDMPFLKQDLIQYMLDKIDGFDAVVPKFNKRLQPLCSIYSRNCITTIKNELLLNNLKLTNFIKKINAKILFENKIKRIDPSGSSFMNINTPEEYEALNIK